MTHPFIRLLPHGHGDPCAVCAGRFDGDKVVDGGVFPGREFVEFRVQDGGGDGPVMPGALVTQHDEPGRTVRMARDPRSGAAVPVTEMHPVICSVCLEVAGREIGLTDATLVASQRDTEREHAETAERSLAEAERELAEVKAGYGVVQQLHKLLGAEQEQTATKSTTKTRSAA